MLQGEKSINCCILDFKRNKFLGVHRFTRNDGKLQESQAGNEKPFSDFLNGLCTAIPWLKNPFKLVKVGFDGEMATLVPSSLFDPNDSETYFKFNFRKNQDEQIRYDHLMPLDAWQVFTIPDAILESTQRVFHIGKVIHGSSLLIESVWINYKNRISSTHIFLNVRNHLFDLMVFDGRQMSYFNTFPFHNPEDVAYYLIFVMEQLGFNPETVPLVLLGDVETGQDLFELLLRYVRHIEMGRRNEAYRYSYILNQLSPQSQFPLLNFFSCGL